MSLWTALFFVTFWIGSPLYAADWNICSHGSSSDATGTLSDSGGADGDYGNLEYCSFLISPGGSPEQITLSFSSFAVEFVWDGLWVYDGTDSFGTLLGVFSGFSLPGDVVATSGSIYLSFSSNLSNTYPGFTASWTSTGDSTPPAAVTDLAAGSVTQGSITLTWTAPGDDGNSGTATGYDVRYSTSFINDANWAGAAQAAGEPAPLSAGSTEAFVVTGLDPGTTYYFAVQTIDEAANPSGLSNIAGGTTDTAAFCGAGNLVMVTADGTTDNGYDNQKRTLFESWGFTVTAIADDAAQAAFNNAAAANDVMFISESIGEFAMGIKARDLDIGIVLEDGYLTDEMAFVTLAVPTPLVDNRIDILDNGHYITSGFDTGYLTVYTAVNSIWGNLTTWASGGQWLARTPAISPTLYAFESGDALAGGVTAPNRRVSAHFLYQTDPAIWNGNLKTLLLRSLAWATCSSGVTQPTISGRVFEDVQYGGGSGRSFAEASGAVGRAGVSVELYDSSGAFLSSVSTDADGRYAFSGLSAAPYTVRVVNSTVTSSRSGATSAEVAVQTFRADGDGESAGTGANKVGGEQPQSTDAPANSGFQTLSDLQSPAGQYAQSIATVSTSGGSIGGIDFGFNFDTIVNTNTSGQGSLRQFMQNANHFTGTQTSQFMIPTSDTGYNGSGNGAFTITPTSALPVITDTVVLDGTTQTNNMGNSNTGGPEIELNGSLAGIDANGLSIDGAAEGCTVRGLAINRFGIDGIAIFSNGNTIQGNYIGTNVTGTLDYGNGNDGIHVEGGSSNIFGGTNPGEGNLLSGNGDDGITLMDNSDSNVIQGNLIGTNAAGTIGIGNSDEGVVIWNLSDNNIVGGTSSGAANVIAYNGTGVAFFYESQQNTAIGNAIYANNGLGIDLSLSNSSDGVTPNDINDSDSGANGLLNYPEITTATAAGGTISLDFDLDVPAGNYRIEFYNNPSGADPSGFGEGQSLAGTAGITHTGGGTQSFSHSFSGAVGDIITATATIDQGGGNYGSTSEFSAAYTATNPPPNIDLTKVAGVISDPFNGTLNPKIIPGAVLDCTVTVTNQGGPTDADTVIITNPVSDKNMLFVGDLAGAGSGPVSFSDGSTASGLIFTFDSLAGTTDSIFFSNDNGSTYTYSPTPDATGYDANVTHLRVSPAGVFAASDSSNHPTFSIAFRVKVK